MKSSRESGGTAAVQCGKPQSYRSSLTIITRAAPRLKLSVTAWLRNKLARTALVPAGFLLLFSAFSSFPLTAQITPGLELKSNAKPEYLWYEAENMRGFSTGAMGEPLLNPSWRNLPKAKAPGWGINGPGVSAEWSQGGESEWNSAAASADETSASIQQEVEVPRAGEYRLWVRYADWANKTENFGVRITQQGKEIFHQEFGARDRIDPHDEVSMYWAWAFTWDSAVTSLAKGPAHLSIEIEKAAEARRHLDCVLLTNDLDFLPNGRRKPDFAGIRYLRELTEAGTPLPPLLAAPSKPDTPTQWRIPKLAGRDFVMPWNIAKEFWNLYDKPPPERPLYPFNAEPIEDFIKKYSGTKEVPIFDSKLVVPVIYIGSLPEYLKEGSPFLRYLRETHTPFAVLINYGSAQMPEGEGQAAWKLLNGELRDQFLGWISGESVGFVWDSAPKELKLSSAMSRRDLLEAHRVFYDRAISRKWADTFHTQTGAMWDRLIPAQSTSSTSFAHALSAWGVRLLGIETAAVQPMFGMRIAFTRGAARQYGGAFLYYHAPNFGDTATTFTKAQNFAGPDNFLHSRYGATMGPSLSWYRKSYYLYYMAGASAISLEQGFDQFFKPGPGENPFQLNPLGRITAEFMRFAEQHPNRGTPYTPIAFLLDPAHGWDMTDYPQWPFEVSPVNRSDRALRELFGAAYYPGTVVEGEPATADRQAFVSSPFGDIFDVIVATETTTGTAVAPPVTNAAGASSAGTAIGSDRLSSPANAINNYRAVVVGGRIDWRSGWAQRLTDYVRNGGVIALNAAQTKGLSADFLGVRSLGSSAEADGARCLAGNEPAPDLSGQLFRYDRFEVSSAEVLIAAPNKDPLVTINQLGRGKVVFSALPDLLGEDERITPFAAHLLAHLFTGATPLEISGDLEYLINRTERGWIVTLINNNGVLKPQQGLAQVDRAAIVEGIIRLRQGRIESARDWLSDGGLRIDRQRNPESVTLKVAPGGVAIVELVVP